jgi:hypothetical protein
MSEDFLSKTSHCPPCENRSERKAQGRKASPEATAAGQGGIWVWGDHKIALNIALQGRVALRTLCHGGWFSVCLA